MTNEEYKPVTFENSLGETISNDPVWNAQRTLEAAGLGNNTWVPGQVGDEDESVPDEFDDLDGKGLQAYAKENDIEVPKTIKKVGELRDFLRANAPEAEDDASSDDSGDDGSSE